jgi:hypothetical protein
VTSALGQSEEAKRHADAAVELFRAKGDLPGRGGAEELLDTLRRA